jgi:hypothetical protein
MNKDEQSEVRGKKHVRFETFSDERINQILNKVIAGANWDDHSHLGVLQANIMKICEMKETDQLITFEKRIYLDPRVVDKYSQSAVTGLLVFLMWCFDWNKPIPDPWEEYDDIIPLMQELNLMKEWEALQQEIDLDDLGIWFN